MTDVPSTLADDTRATRVLVGHWKPCCIRAMCGTKLSASTPGTATPASRLFSIGRRAIRIPAEEHSSTEGRSGYP